MLASQLRSKYPEFIYQKYSWKIIDHSLVASFQYSIKPNLNFTSSIKVHHLNDDLNSQDIDSFVFNIGLSEMLSYWKVTASPLITVKAGSLSNEQLKFWHKLLIKGMGEFFLVNNIKFTDPNFVKIQTLKSNHLSRTSQRSTAPVKNILIPIGGGKDSAVSLDILAQKFKVATLGINPTPASLAVIENSGIKKNILVTRTLDPQLLELNSQGYLNGHVPISASIAFISLLVAHLFNYSHITISNERSSNEGNTKFCSKVINHQYSKSYEFEQDLQQYVTQFLPKNSPRYFSFLRPLYELQIAKLFARKEMTKYHATFRSCNKGQKTNSWCGSCSKCLFAYTILFPFMKPQQYFNKDMFTDLTLWPIAQELLGVSNNKPLDCVGTYEESTVAFYLSTQKYLKNNQRLPVLLDKINKEVLNKQKNLETRANNILTAWNQEESLPTILRTTLQKYVK